MPKKKKPTRLDRIEEFMGLAGLAIQGLHDRLTKLEPDEEESEEASHGESEE